MDEQDRGNDPRVDAPPPSKTIKSGMLGCMALFIIVLIVLAIFVYPR
jgi:hypothetical protein